MFQNADVTVRDAFVQKMVVMLCIVGQEFETRFPYMNMQLQSRSRKH